MSQKVAAVAVAEVATAQQPETTAVAVRNTVVEEAQFQNDIAITYNGEACETTEQKVNAIRKHFQLSILRKWGINPKDEEGNPMRNVLELNGKIMRPKLAKPEANEYGVPVEDPEAYYKRTLKHNASLYDAMFMGVNKAEYILNEAL